MDLTQTEIDRRMEEFNEAFRKNGLLLTHQRMEIFLEVARTEEHPDAETLYNGVRSRIPVISLDTVYRTLALLEKLKLINRVYVKCDRARYDANMNQHHHFVCTECGLMRDVSDLDRDSVAIPPEVHSWGSVDSVHVEFRGLCSKCVSSEPAGKGVRGGESDEL